MAQDPNRTDSQYLRSLVGGVSKNALKHWLKVSDLPHSASNDVAFYKLLQTLIVEDKLRIQQLRHVVLEIEEYGEKRIYLGKLRNYQTIGLRQRFENHLKRLGHTLDEQPVAAKPLPGRPTLNYITWSSREVRIGFSETHQFVRISRAHVSIEKRPHTNLIIISADPQTGLIKIMMDPPGDEHPHDQPTEGTRSEAYEKYYEAKALELLGADAIVRMDLLKVAEDIVKPRPQIFEPIDSDVLTSHGYRARIWGRSDIRNEPVYTASEKVDGTKWVHESLRGYWLPDASNGRLRRKLYMHLSRREGMVWFPADCLASEVEYAIATIRAI